jgi:hypothetical protein
VPNKESNSWLSLILNASVSLLSFNVIHFVINIGKGY